jgi:hypothetical protein
VYFLLVFVKKDAAKPFVSQLDGPFLCELLVTSFVFVGFDYHAYVKGTCSHFSKWFSVFAFHELFAFGAVIQSFVGGARSDFAA